MTPGNVTDYAFVESEIMELGSLYNIKSIGYDPWNATQLATSLEEQGVNMRRFGQYTKNFNEPINWIERNTLQDNISHEGDPVLTWMLGNIDMYVDTNGNRKFNKGKSREKIDGFVALAMAVGEYLDLKEEESVYNDRDGILMF